MISLNRYGHWYMRPCPAPGNVTSSTPGICLLIMIKFREGDVPYERFISSGFDSLAMSQPIILVTGSTDGIGKETALELASRGAEVILHGRNTEKIRAVQRELEEKTGSGKPDFLLADFSDMDQIRTMGDEISSRYTRLSVLINNAGTFQKTRKLTKDGIELTFAVNYLAPFLITNLLVPLLRKNAPSRIVSVASSAHYDVDRVDWGNLPAMPRYKPWDAYSLSKFADVTFTYTLSRNIDRSGISANCLHPGVTNTKILRTAFPGMAGIPSEQGAETSVYLALSPEVEGVSGRYFEEKKPVRSSELSYDRSIQERLWKVAEVLTHHN